MPCGVLPDDGPKCYITFSRMLYYFHSKVILLLYKNLYSVIKKAREYRKKPVNQLVITIEPFWGKTAQRRTFANFRQRHFY